MTAEESDALQAANEANEVSEERIRARGNLPPRFIHTIHGDEHRHRSPKIARSRAVVERAIGAMKDYLILSNIPFLSVQPIDTIFRIVVIVAALCNYNLGVRGTSW